MLLCMRFESHHTMFQSLDARVFGDVQGFIVAIAVDTSDDDAAMCDSAFFAAAHTAFVTTADFAFDFKFAASAFHDSAPGTRY